MNRLLALLLLFATASGQDLASELAKAVDLPAPKERRSAADALAKAGHTIDTLMRVMREFRPAGALKTGTRHRQVDLRVMGRIERTDLHLYVADSYDAEQPAPLMLALHGSGGDGANQLQWWQGIADRMGMIVLAPTEAGKNAGYGFSARERTAALAALRWVRRQYNIDENRVYVTGISRGGHLTWDLILRHPDVFAAAAPMIGGPRRTLAKNQNNLRYLDNVLDLPIRDLQGAKDHPILLESLRWTFVELNRRGAKDAKLIEFPEMGHSFEFNAVSWVDWLDGARREPVPKTVRRAAANKTESRALWIEVVRTDSSVKEKVRAKVDRSWSSLSDEQKRLVLQEQADRQTARLEVTMTAPGRFAAKARAVKKFRLHLAPGMWKAGEPIEVAFLGKTYKRKIRPNPQILLREFVERFDRTFLPVATVSIP